MQKDIANTYLPFLWEKNFLCKSFRKYFDFYFICNKTKPNLFSKGNVLRMMCNFYPKTTATFLDPE